MEVVDKRKLDEGGDIKAGVEKLEEAEALQIEKELAEAQEAADNSPVTREEVKFLFARIQQDAFEPMQQSLSNLVIRMNTLEELLTARDLKVARDKMLGDTLEIDDLVKISQDVILPRLQQEAKDLHEKLLEQQKQMEQAAEEAENKITL